MVIYSTPQGSVPFEEWFESLKDRSARAHVFARLGRVRLGNLGDAKSVGEGVHELRINVGPGYRVYLGQDGDVLVILLCGGDKRTQRRDIATAKEYWQSYKRRTS